MNLIKTFKCTQTEITFTGPIIVAEGLVKIREELVRPQITFEDSDGEKINLNSNEVKLYKTKLEEEPFDKEEVIFLAKKFDFKTKNHERHSQYLTSTLDYLNKLYDCAGIITLIEYKNKEYIMITFERWQFEYQPRGAAEDMHGEDITYVHGIWENPLLTDEIIKKIKQ
jgi:hypothetical protein